MVWVVGILMTIDSWHHSADDEWSDHQITVNTAAAAQTSDQGAAETLYTVKRGDTLSAIAKTFYKDASKYPRIFEVNKPMLRDANKIYPGQVLRIPTPE